MGRLITFPMPRYTFLNLKILGPLIHFGFRTQNQFQARSLKGFGKRVSTRHRMQDETQIKEPLIPFYLWHRIIVWDDPTPYAHGRKHHFWPRSKTRVLLSEAHCKFCNRGSKAIKWTTRAYGQLDYLSHAQIHLLKLRDPDPTYPLWFQDLKQIIGRIPKWLQEASFNSPQNAS